MDIYLLSISFAMGTFFSWLISRYALRFALLDIPNDRSSHKLPTPRGGGVGILFSFIFVSLYLSIPIMLWIPASLLAVVSFLDDKLDLTPCIRLFYQFSAALVTSGYIFTSSGAFSSQSPLLLIKLLVLVVLSTVIIVGTANFYNFMDGINGIAGISGIVAFCLIGYFADFISREPAISLSAYAMAAACLGFLPFNVPKARVFMGDVGSILLGFVFAAYLVLLCHSLTDFLVMAGFLSTFYIDALTTLYARKRDGERLSQAHRRHLYQLFTNQLQVPHWKVSLSFGLVQLLIGLLLLAVHPYGVGVVVGVIIILVSIWIFVMHKVRLTVEAR